MRSGDALPPSIDRVYGDIDDEPFPVLIGFMGLPRPVHPSIDRVYEARFGTRHPVLIGSMKHRGGNLSQYQ